MRTPTDRLKSLGHDAYVDDGNADYQSSSVDPREPYKGGIGFCETSAHNIHHIAKSFEESSQ